MSPTKSSQIKKRDQTTTNLDLQESMVVLVAIRTSIVISQISLVAAALRISFHPSLAEALQEDHRDKVHSSGEALYSTMLLLILKMQPLVQR